MKRIVSPLLAGALLACAFATMAAAARAADVDKQIEASMVVTGSIEVEPDGSVSGYKLDQPDKLPKGVGDLVAQAVPEWKFEPVLVDGKAVAARAKMSLRIVAHPLGPERYEVLIRSANFGEKSSGTDSVEGKAMPPPHYPSKMVRRGVSGTVYLVVRIGRNGQVEDAIAQQVNLKTSGSASEMSQWRATFAKSAVDATRKWTFVPPTTGEEADDDYWLVRVPIAYEFYGTPKKKYGEWDAYIPGPRQTIPWQERGQPASSSPDAIADSGVFSLRQSLHLLTPLGEG